MNVIRVKRMHNLERDISRGIVLEGNNTKRCLDIHRRKYLINKGVWNYGCNHRL